MRRSRALLRMMLMSERDGDDCRLLGLLQVMVLPHAEATMGTVFAREIVLPNPRGERWRLRGS